MPARRPSGPTCSSTSSAGSTATATRRSGSPKRPGRSASSRRRGLKYGDLPAGLVWPPAAPGSSTSPTRRRSPASFVRGEAPSVAYATVGVLTATTFVLGGFMREQVCIYMCPWPRIQTAMLDEKSLIVTYKDWRGEPRGNGQARRPTLADVVPARATASTATSASRSARPGSTSAKGPQIGCITCALCIDACDEVMAQDRPAARPDRLCDPRRLQAGSRRAEPRDRS